MANQFTGKGESLILSLRRRPVKVIDNVAKAAPRAWSGRSRSAGFQSWSYKTI